MPTHKRLGLDDGDGVEDRWKPSIQLDEEQAVIMVEPDTTVHLAAQNNQLMSEYRVLCFKPALRLKR